MEPFLNSGLMRVLAVLCCVAAPIATGCAHHSFAPYDIRNPVEISGVAERFAYRRPHPKLSLVDEEGVTWEIEVPIRRWEAAGLTADHIEAGDELTVRAFPARNGSPKAAMSGFKKNGEYFSVTEEIRQRSGNEAADALERGEPLEEVLEKYSKPQ